MNAVFVPSLIGEFLTPGAIAPSITARTKRQALNVAAEVAARACGLKPARVFEALWERETLGSTGVGHGVAIPHARLAGLDRVRGVFLRLKPPVDFGAVDDEPVDLIFALLAPAACGSDHLRAMARVARELRSAELRQQLRQASGVDAILALLTRDARPSAA